MLFNILSYLKTTDMMRLDNGLDGGWGAQNHTHCGHSYKERLCSN